MGPARSRPARPRPGPAAWRSATLIRAPQLRDPERLRHVVVGAALEGLDLLPLLEPPRQDHDRCGCLPPDRPDDLGAVAVGQSQVEQDEIRPAGREPLEAGPARPPPRRRGTRPPSSRASTSRVAPSSSMTRITAPSRSAGHVAASAAGSRRRGRAAGRGRSPGRRAHSACRDTAAGRLDQAPHDGQADAKAAARTSARARRPVELLEEVRQRAVGHARPAVLDRQAHRARSDGLVVATRIRASGGVYLMALSRTFATAGVEEHRIDADHGRRDREFERRSPRRGRNRGRWPASARRRGRTAPGPRGARRPRSGSCRGGSRRAR